MRKLSEHEQRMSTLGCPDCGNQIELYDSNTEGTSGRYRCSKCGRDTNWSVVASVRASSFLKNFMPKASGV